jgi:L-rhamnose-H+ transport protein
LTFGLTMRSLGLSLGMGVALGYCAGFGTMFLLAVHGAFTGKVLGTGSGRVILTEVGICLLGIALAGSA